MLFDSIQIKNYTFSLLHAERGIGNKIIKILYHLIIIHVEPLSDEEVEISNMLIDLHI